MGKSGRVLVKAGALLVLAALCLAAYNGWDDRRAASELAEQTVLAEAAVSAQTALPPAKTAGDGYAGVLDIPALGRKLPVLERCDEATLRRAPCRYTGRADTDDLVIAAHNYTSHFGRLKELRQGDRLCFTDSCGNVFSYEVVLCEILPAAAVEEMTAGEWALTLFTCTLGGRSRVTVRCERVERE